MQKERRDHEENRNQDRPGPVGNASRRRKELFDPPRYRGAGTTLTRAAVALSEDLGPHGWIGLHPLPQADGGHADTCGMADLGADPDDEDLRDFETTPEQARASFAREGDT